MPKMTMKGLVADLRDMASDLEQQLASGQISDTQEVPDGSEFKRFNWKKRLVVAVSVAVPKNDAEAGEYQPDEVSIGGDGGDKQPPK